MQLSPVPIPTGLIAMWSGALANIPSGWALCDGAGGTPDLRSKFVRGAAAGQNPGGTGGSDSITPSSHTHGSGTLGMNSIGNHAHTVNSHTHSGGSLGFRLAGTRTIVASIGPHHVTSNVGINNMRFAPNNWYGATGGSAPGTSSLGAHAHTMSGSTAGGASNAFDNRPAYYALAFIIKT